VFLVRISKIYIYDVRMEVFHTEIRKQSELHAGCFHMPHHASSVYHIKIKINGEILTSVFMRRKKKSGAAACTQSSIRSTRALL
jgi:hypothetical protein